MKIIITGATSFVGRATAACLKSRGHEVIELRHSFEENPELLPESADAWIHYAWAGAGSAGRSDVNIQNFNVEMTLQAVRKAAQIGCGRFLFAGSQAEYGHAQDGSLKREDGAASPVSEYGKAKLRVLEEAVKLCGSSGIGGIRNSSIAGNGMSYIHMRLFSVYGPGDHDTSLINTLVKGFAKGDTVRLGPCAQDWNYLYIDDAALAVAYICEKGGAGIWNIAGNCNKQLAEYVREVYSIMGEQGCIAFGVRADNAEGPADLSADIEKLKALGFEEKVSFEDGIGKVIESLN